MAKPLTSGLGAGLLAVVLIAPAAAAAQDIGGQVVEDPYADFPRIVLDERVPEPPLTSGAAVPAPRPGPGRVEPYPVAPPAPSPVTPAEALGLAIGQTLLRELDRALSGRGRYDD